jgi:hypothetical protein
MKKNHNSSIFIEKEIREIRVIRGALSPRLIDKTLPLSILNSQLPSTRSSAWWCLRN